MRPSILIATAVSGVIVALAFLALMKQRAPDPGQGPPDPTVTGRQPAFHLDATPAQRRTILESAFPKIASERAVLLGAIKDDVALLLDDPEAVALVVTQWHVHKAEGRYAEAAFADLFRLVKNPAFVEPTATLLEAQKPEIRRKALQSAETQASPALGSRVLAIFREGATLPADEGVSLRRSALHAGFACKGDAWPALLDLAIGDEDSEIAIEALTFAADLDVPGLESHARELLTRAKDPRVRLYAAALLMRRGDLSASGAIISALDPKDPALAADAVHLVAKYRIAAARSKLVEIRPHTTGEIRRLFTLALLRLGDQDVLNEVMQAADVLGGEAEIDALRLLAAGGDENVTPILLHALGRGGLARAHAIAAGISTSAQPGFLPVIEKLVEAPVGHPAELFEAPKVGGKALIPKIAGLLHEATDPTAQVRYLAWLEQIGGPEARDVMIRERQRIPRLVDERLRLVDLEARRLGQATPAPH